MSLGLSMGELTKHWNDVLRSLNCTFAPIQTPPGVDTAEFERLDLAIRVPETDPVRYSTYRAYTDITAAMMSVIIVNNKRIAEQLATAGVRIE